MSVGFTIPMARALLADGRAAEVTRMIEPLLSVDPGAGIQPTRSEEIVLRSLLARIRLLDEGDADAARATLLPVSDARSLADAEPPARAEAQLWLGWCDLLDADPSGDWGRIRLAIASALARQHASHDVVMWCHIGRAMLASEDGHHALACNYAAAARSIQLAVRSEHAKAWLERLPCSSDSPTTELPDTVAASPVMTEPIASARVATRSSVSFLIIGERGSGRRHLARAVHRASNVSGDFFVIRVGDASSTPEDVVARAVQTDGSTLCLHDVDEQPTATQKLVADAAGRSSTRLVCTTTRDFVSLVDSGRVDRRLLAACALLQIDLPPLRKRAEDVDLLVRCFLRAMRREEGLPAAVTDEALSLLSRYGWPGNVRQLRNEIERALVHVQSEPAPVIRASVLSPEVRGPGHVDDTPARDEGDLDRILAQTEKAVIESVLAQTGGQVAASAEQLGLTRQGLYKKLKRLGVDPAKYQNGRAQTPAGADAPEERQYA